MKPPISLKLLSLLLLSALTLSGVAWYMGVYAPRSRAALGPNGVNILFSPSSGTVQVGSDQTITVTLVPVTNTNKISGIDMTFNATGVMKIKDISAPTNLPTELVKNIAVQSGRISYVNSGPNDQLPSTIQFNVVFTSADSGTGSIQLDVSKTQVVGTLASTVFDLGTNLASITFTFNSNTGPTATPTAPVTPPTSTPSPTPVVTQPAGGGTAMSFDMRFQGVVTQPSVPGSIPVQVRLVKNGLTSDPAIVNMTPGGNGVWSGTAQVPAQPGSGYTLLVKGPRHLQKKICVNNPSETAIGTYRCSTGNVTVTAGVNRFDLSKITLLVGDLPDQDGTVDSYDTSYIRQSLGSTSANDLTVADVNRDGIVDTQDMSLVIQALNVKYDEE